MNNIGTSLKRWWTLRGFWTERADFYRSIARSLERKELLRDFAEGELRIALSPVTADKHKALGLTAIRNVLEQGISTLSDVLQAVMPAQDRMALATLKESKEQIVTLRHLADGIDMQAALNKVLFSALFAPALLVPVGFIFAYTLATVSFPLFVESAPPEIWTGFNLFLRNTSEGFSNYGPAVFGVMVLGLVWLFTWALANLTADWRYQAEKAVGKERLLWTMVFPMQPVLRMHRDIAGTRFLTDLAFILQTGALLNDALETMARSAQPWMRKHIVKILNHLQEFPGDYVGAFGHGMLSPFLTGRLHSQVRVDARGRFDQVLIDVGARGQADAREAVRKSATQLNAVLLFVTMGTIAFFYMGQGVVIKSIEEATSPAAVMKREAAKRHQ